MQKLKVGKFLEQIFIISLFVRVAWWLASSVKWSVLAHLESQPRGQNFQAQKPVKRSSPKTLESTKMPKTHLK